MRAERSQEPRILARPDHPISRKNVDENTLKVLYRLHNSGKKAYLVGGAVRDLMLGRRPKDFDIGTDARPAEIRRLFRNSRIIGRRFRLAHVYFQGDVVEVATFRREPSPEDQQGADEDLLITSDNTYGTPREDAFRRDFTINALFYDIGDFSVIDYVGGIDDLREKTVRVIGDPDVRFREDPVRMARAIEFAARLGFEIEPETGDGIERNRQEILKASPARMTEELVQLLTCGHAGDALQLMLDYGLLDILVPEVDDMVEAEERGLGAFHRIPLVLDALVEEERKPNDAVLLAALLLPTLLLRRFEEEESAGGPLSRRDLAALVEDAIEPFVARFQLSNARTAGLRDTLNGFLRLCEPAWTERQRKSFVRRTLFDDALALFEIAVRATGEGAQALAAWREVAAERPEPPPASEERRAGPRRGRGRRRRRRRRRG